MATTKLVPMPEPLRRGSGDLIASCRIRDRVMNRHTFAVTTGPARSVYVDQLESATDIAALLAWLPAAEAWVREGR